MFVRNHWIQIQPRSRIKGTRRRQVLRSFGMFLLGKGIWRETIIILCYVYLNSNEIAIFYFVTISIARDELTFPCKLKIRG